VRRCIEKAEMESVQGQEGALQVCCCCLSCCCLVSKSKACEEAFLGSHHHPWACRGLLESAQEGHTLWGQSTVKSHRPHRHRRRGGVGHYRRRDTEVVGQTKARVAQHSGEAHIDQLVPNHNTNNPSKTKLYKRNKSKINSLNHLFYSTSSIQ
jgi:hypothetical protein